MSTNLGQYVTVRHVRLVDEPVTEVFRLGVHEEHNLFLFLQEWLEALHKGSITGDNLSLQPGPQGRLCRDALQDKGTKSLLRLFYPRRLLRPVLIRP